jgi:Flp pilus assembly protein TadG
LRPVDQTRVSWFSRFRRSERGSALVEAAIILPVLMTIIFGTIEWGMTFKDSLSVSTATRSGARTASAEPRTSGYQTDAANAVKTAVQALPAAGPQELWIYKAGTDGAPVDNSDNNTNSFANCGTNRCYKFTWNSASKSWTAVAGYSWTYTLQNACSGTANSIGIYLKDKHTFITHLFDPILGGNSKMLTDHTVMRLEPMPASQVCQ